MAKLLNHKITFPLTLAVAAAMCSHKVFASFGDPEGPNFPVVMGLATLIWSLSLVFYLSNAVRKLPKSLTLLLALIVQMIVAISFSVLLR